MGVTGLWKLIDSAGKPIPIETLENKVLAIDVSIWLHQLVRGLQDAPGKTVINAHLIGLFHRILKLLFFRIKPIFVFDGGVPALKRKTITARQQNRSKALRGSEKSRLQLLKNLIKQQALGKISGKSFIMSRVSLLSTSNKDSLFELPPLPESDQSVCAQPDYNSGGSSESEEESQTEYWGDIHSINVKSKDFQALPPEIRHSILSELKETRKQSSWMRAHKMPEKSGEFSSFQMSRLLNRRSVQAGIEEAQKQLGGNLNYTMAEIREKLSESGVEFSQRIASSSTASYVYASNKDVTRPKLLQPPVDYDDVNKDVVGIANEILERKEELIDDSEDEDELSNLAPFVEDKNLSQAEILQIIKAQNTSKEPKIASFDESQPSTSKAALEYELSLKENCVNDFKVQDSGNLNNGTPCKLEPGTIPENDSSSKSKAILSRINKSSSSVLEQTARLDNKPVINEEKNSVPDTITQEKKTKNGEEVNFISSSSSDEDDDFVEVPVKNDALEIVIKPEESISPQCDLFADIFAKPAESEQKETTTAVETLDENSTASSDEEPQQSQSSVDPTLFEEVSKNAAVSFEDTIKLLSSEDVKKMEEELEAENAQLVAQKRREEKIGASISEQFTLEAQELLQMFGLPYLVAPMEAEAQCAFLDISGQTEGTISDDSDIWLFGGQTVYKNFFDQKKFVLQFKNTDIERNFKLSREDMILLALLTGSDYTTGLNGIGPVTAIEILSSFPSLQSDSSPLQRLQRFTLYYKSGKLSAGLMRRLHTTHIYQGFPNSEVLKAYLQPQVNEDKEPFSWSLPDLPRIREYTREKFGWDQRHTDSTLVPVLEKLKQTTTQKTLHGFFEWAKESFSKEKVSKRVIKAVENWGQLADEDQTEKSPKKKRKLAVPRVDKKVPASGESTTKSIQISSNRASAYSKKFERMRARKKKAETEERQSTSGRGMLSPN